MSRRKLHAHSTTPLTTLQTRPGRVRRRSAAHPPARRTGRAPKHVKKVSQRHKRAKFRSSPVWHKPLDMSQYIKNITHLSTPKTGSEVGTALTTRPISNNNFRFLGNYLSSDSRSNHDYNIISSLLNSKFRIT